MSRGRSFSPDLQEHFSQAGTRSRAFCCTGPGTQIGAEEVCLCGLHSHGPRHSSKGCFRRNLLRRPRPWLAELAAGCGDGFEIFIGVKVWPQETRDENVCSSSAFRLPGTSPLFRTLLMASLHTKQVRSNSVGTKGLKEAQSFQEST